MFVIILGYHSLLGGHLYITCLLNGKTLLVACTWFLVTGFPNSTCGQLFAACQACILAVCDIGISDLACLAYNSFIGYCKPLLSEVFCIKSGQNGDFHLFPWLWKTCFLQAMHIFYSLLD